MRKAKLDSGINRLKREIKSLTKKLKGRTRILSKRQARRAKLN
jgi:hypothetical protein